MDDAMAMAPRVPHPVDVHVGGRVRMRRKARGLSQEQLADVLKLTFQQVQKYERGANRISASKLYSMAQALQVPVSFFFDGLSDPAPVDGLDPSESVNRTIAAFLSLPEGMGLAKAFQKLGAARTRRQVLDLARALAEEAGCLAPSPISGLSRLRSPVAALERRERPLVQFRIRERPRGRG